MDSGSFYFRAHTNRERWNVVHGDPCSDGNLCWLQVSNDRNQVRAVEVEVEVVEVAALFQLRVNPQNTYCVELFEKVLSRLLNDSSTIPLPGEWARYLIYYTITDLQNAAQEVTEMAFQN